MTSEHENGGARSEDAPAKPTALQVAKLRAAHQLLDRPLVFEDPLALRILGEAEEEALRQAMSQHDDSIFKGLRASLAVRGKFAEDAWNAARRDGVEQFVILGAGLDTTAYRDPAQHPIRIFEVDLPATQRWKRACLRAAAIPEPETLTFVPVDFERDTLSDALQRAGFRADAPAFFSWLGVTMYLDEDTCTSTWRYIASLPHGSRVVFDYTVHPNLLSPRERIGLSMMSARTAEQGEPWKSQFEPDALSAKLRGLGFGVVEDFGAEQLNAQYLAGRADGLRKSGVTRLMRATV